MNAELSVAAGGTMPGEQGSQLAGWSLTGAVEAGTSELHLQSYANLRVGDILELSPGLPTAEIVTIVRFGSVFVASPLCFAHAGGTQVRRVIEGSGPSFEAHGDSAAQPRSRPQRSNAGSPSTADLGNPDLDGFESSSRWSERERRHQLERHRRK